MKIKSFIFNAIPVCLGLLGIHAAMAQAEESPAPESVSPAQVSLQLEHALLQNETTTAEANIAEAASSETQENTPKTETRVKLRMSRSINNFDALNDKPETVEVDALAFKKVSDEEKNMLADGGVIMEGDRIEVQMGRTITALGNGVMRTNSQTMLGDRLEFDEENRMLHAVGHASIETDDSLAKGPAFHLNIDESTGEMPNASFTMYKPLIKLQPLGSLGDKLYGQQSINTPDLMAGVVDRNMMPVNGETKPIFSADESPTENKTASSRGDAQMLYFEGDGKKRLVKSRYTTCAADSDDWYIKSGQLKIDGETKVAVATNATVEFKGVPVLYTPWINFPYANQRKSGLLAPTWGTTTKSGFELLTPFYWNISPNMDATVATRFLSKRGIQYQGEFRYLEENYSGIDNIEYLPTDDMTQKERYFAKIKHQQNFSNGWSAGLDVQKVSDNQYFSDLSTHIITTSQVNLLQQANVNYAGSTWQFGALAQRYQTLDGVSYPYQRVPQLTLNGAKDWEWGTGRIQNQLTQFEMDNLATNQAVKSGTRFSTYPSFTMPITRPYGYVTPKFGVNYTSYNLDSIDPLHASEYDKTADRTLPIFSLDSGLFFERDTSIISHKYTQTLEPRLFYVYIPYQDQSRLPVFDTGLMDLNMGTLFAENQYSGGDRINNANQLSYSLSSRMIDAETGEQRLAATAGQRFYFEDQKVGLPGETLRSGTNSDIFAAATARLRNKWNLDAAWQYNTDSGDTVKANIGARYAPEPGKILNISYRFTRDTLEQINVSSQWPLGRGYYGLGRVNYSIYDGKAVEALAGIEYDAGCWQSRVVIQRVQTATSQANYALFYQLELGGMASIGANPLQLINRNIPGYKSSGLLPDNYRQEYNE